MEPEKLKKFQCPDIATYSLIAVMSVFGTCVMLWQVARIGTEFLGEPSASSVEMTHPKAFPELTYCPRDWMDPDVIENELSMPFDAYRFMISLFPFVPDIEYLMATRVFIPDPIASVIEGEAAQMSYLKFLSNCPQDIQSMEDLVHRITVPWQKRISVQTSDDFSPNKNLTIYTRISSSLPCYIIGNHSNLTMLSAMLTHEDFIFNLSKPFVDYAKTFPNRVPEPTGRLIIGPQGPSVYPKGLERNIHPGINYHISLGSTQEKNYNSKNHPCKLWGSPARGDCIFNCMNDHLCAGICKMFSPPGTIGPRNDTELCSLFFINTPRHCYDRVFHESRFGIEKVCEEQCPPSCSTESYAFEVTEAPNPTEPNIAHVRISFYDPWNTIRVVQYPTYTIDTLISNVAGIVTLFSGISYVSVVKDAVGSFVIGLT